METDRFANLFFYESHGLARCNATGEIRHVSRVVTPRLLNDHRIAHQRCSFRPDCFKILFSVPGARSSDGLPATVTRPGRTGCLYCRWLPRVATKNHPS